MKEREINRKRTREERNKIKITKNERTKTNQIRSTKKTIEKKNSEQTKKMQSVNNKQK